MATNQINYTFVNGLGVSIVATGYRSGVGILLSNITKTTNGLEDKSIFFPFADRLGNVVAPEEFENFASDNLYKMNVTDFTSDGGNTEEGDDPLIDIKFKVLDENGSAISGANVRIVDSNDNVYNALTNGSGSVTFSGMVPGRYRVLPQKTGRGEWSLVGDTDTNGYWSKRTISISDGSETVLTLYKNFFVRFAVEDSVAKTPIEGVLCEMEIPSKKQKNPGSSYTSSTGVTSISVPAGTYTATVRAPGYEDKVLTSFTVTNANVTQSVDLVALH